MGAVSRDCCCLSSLVWSALLSLALDLVFSLLCTLRWIYRWLIGLLRLDSGLVPSVSVVGGSRDCGVFFSFFLLLVGGLVAALPFPFSLSVELEGGVG